MPESLLNLPEILASHARWLACDPSGQRANLDEARLDRASLNRASLDGASLNGANLDGASLNRANLDEARLDRASLNRASLVGASLDGVTGIVIAADAPQRLRAAAAAALQEGALEMGAWHSCDTTHCLGGWLIHQAGEVGRLLEATVGPGIAGLMLGGVEAHSHFYDSNEAATEWLRSVLAQPEAKS
jgi:pimeloyl-ACP methyl ester carboxylesterase